MKKLACVLVVLVAVTGISFALEVGGSTAAGVIGNGDEQILKIDQEVDIDIGALHLDADGGFDYTFHDKGKAWDYELGAAYTMGIFTFGGTFGGDNEVLLGNITAYADIAVDSVGADVDFLFSADEAKDVFQGADFSAFYNPGNFEFRVGYLLTENGEPDVNAPELLTDGGLYAKAKVSY